MSIASHFRAKMDVALNSADCSLDCDLDARRTNLAQALDAADLILMDKASVNALFDSIAELKSLTPRADRTEREAIEAALHCYACGGTIGSDSCKCEQFRFSRAEIFAIFALRPTPPVEGEREALEKIEFLATNHGGWFESDPIGEYSKLGDIAREALAALSTPAASGDEL